MADPLLLLPLLLLPVALLLLLNLRFSRRLRYPHFLLAAASRRGPAALLLRSFRTWYDAYVDAAIALVLAFALASSLGSEPRQRKTAVVVDCSRSMLAGAPGQRPLDRAAARLVEEPWPAGARRFALAFDPARRGYRLFPLEALLSGADAAEAALRLERAFTFLGLDYGAMGELGRGYGDIVLLTDRLPGAPEGFRALELGWGGGAGRDAVSAIASAAVWPSSARYDRLSHVWTVTLAESGARAPLAVEVWTEELGGFATLPPSRWRQREGRSGRLLDFDAPGTYLLRLSGPRGIPGADFPVRLPPARQAAEAEGPFSEAMLSVFPSLERLPRPSLLMRDVEEGATSRGVATKWKSRNLPRPGAESPRRVDTVWDGAASTDLGLLDLSLTGGRLVAARGEGGGLAQRSVRLGLETLANPDLPLYYDGLIQAGLPPALVTSPPPDTSRLIPAGSAFLALGPRGATPLVAPPEEFFEPAREGRIVLPAAAPRRLPWAIALLSLFLLKLGLWRRLSGKPLLRPGGQGLKTARGKG